MQGRDPSRALAATISPSTLRTATRLSTTMFPVKRLPSALAMTSIPMPLPLMLLAVPPASVVNGDGMAYANVLWLCQTVQQIGFGVVLMSLGHLSFKDIAGKLDKEQQATSVPSA